MRKLFFSLLFGLSIVVSMAQNSFDRWVPASGTNTYTTNITSYPGSYNNTQVYVKFANANTTAATLAINGMSAQPLRKWDGDSWEILVSGDIDNNTIYKCSYSGSFFQMESFGANGISISGSGTINEITYWTGSSTLSSLTTATYPSLTELSYVKGVTSAIQTQLDSKVLSTININTTSPISGGGDLSADRTISIADAIADGSTKGAASFTSSDFNSSSGNISIDYTNGQSASTSLKGFLTNTDWNIFNNKQSTGLSYLLASGGTLSGPNIIDGTTTNTFTLRFNGLSTTTTHPDGTGISIANETPSSLGAQQNSPGFTLVANSYATTPATAQAVRYRQYLEGVQGTTSSTGIYHFQHKNGGIGSYTDAFTYTTAAGNVGMAITGTLNVSSSIIGATTITAGLTNGFFLSAGVMSIIGNTGTTTVTHTLSYKTAFVGPSSTGLAATQNHYSWSAGFVDATATSALGTFFNLTPTYNLTSSNTSDIVGFNYQPTVTSVMGKHIAATWRTGAFVIGHTTVTANTTKLQVRGNGTTTGVLALFENSSGNEKFKVLDNGDVSINGSGIGNINSGVVTLIASIVGNISELQTSITNTSAPAFTFKHTTSATPTTGIGVGASFELETSAGNNEIVGIIDCTTTDATVGSEDVDMIFKTMTNGATSNEHFRFGSNKIGFFAHSTSAQQSVNTILVNNVTSGGSLSTIANFTDLSVYSNDAATIRNNFYRLTEKVLKLETALRNYGLSID